MCFRSLLPIFPPVGKRVKKNLSNTGHETNWAELIQLKMDVVSSSHASVHQTRKKIQRYNFLPEFCQVIEPALCWQDGGVWWLK